MSDELSLIRSIWKIYHVIKVYIFKNHKALPCSTIVDIFNNKSEKIKAHFNNNLMKKGTNGTRRKLKFYPQSH